MPRSRPRRRSTTRVVVRRGGARGRASGTRRTSVAARRRREPVAAEVGGRERASEGVARGDRGAELAAGSMRSIARRPARLDQLAAHRPQRRVGDGREPQRPVAGECARRRPEQRVAREALVELGRVVVEREHEPRVLEAVLGRRSDDDPPVGRCQRDRPGAVRERRRATCRCGTSARAGTGPVGVTTSSTMPCTLRRCGLTLDRSVSRTSLRCAPWPRYLRPDEARRCRLAPLAPEEAPALPRRAAPDARRRPCSTSVSTRSASVPRAASRAAARTTSSRSSTRGRDRITALGLHDGASFRERYPEIAYVQGDACALPFADESFDVVFSNAVIEHVGDVERQRLFVGEALRVGRRVFLTTPNRWFPIEVHTRLPLVHWLPEAVPPAAPTTSPARAGRGRTTCSARGDLRGLFPGAGADRQPRPHARGDHMSERLPRDRARRLRSSGSRLHNLVMAELWDAGVRGASLDVVAAWKDVLLAAALVVAILAARSLPLGSGPTGSRSSTRAFVLLYWLLPQSWLDGGGDAARPALRRPARPDPGRRLLPRAPARAHAGRLAPPLARCSSGVARRRSPSGASPTSTSCRCSGGATPGVPGWFEEQLGLVYSGLSRAAGELGPEHGRRGQPDPAARLDLPQPARDRVRARDRAALPRRPPPDVVDVSPRPRRLRRPALDAHARGVPRARARARRARGRAAAAACRSCSRSPRSSSGSAFVKAFPHIGPSTSYTQAELEILREQGQQNPGVSDDPLSAGDASTASHLRNLRDGIRTVVRHPQGFGLGNAGVNASRTGVEIKAGESTYTEIGVEIGLVGLARLLRLAGRRPARALAALGLAERRLGRDARDRSPDRRDRRALDRVRPVRARRRRDRRRAARTTTSHASAR